MSAFRERGSGLPACAGARSGRVAFRERQERTLAGAWILADRLLADDCREAGVGVVSGGTDVLPRCSAIGAR